MNAPQQKTILLVEDQAIIAMAASFTLEKNGFKVIKALSGEEAVTLVQKNAGINLILMDIDLGTGMDGTEAAQVILKDYDIPVLFLSSHTEEEIVDKTESITSYGYVVKDSGDTVLIASIRMAFRLHEAKIRERSKEEALLESEERFRTTLYSIGDGVITTDTTGIIRHMNPIAEALTGWTENEAVGRELEEVFHLINEETRTPVDIPVRKVLRDGLIVDLANHTLLISKAGREIPIADSGAPIRNENDEVVGVVLVFRDQTNERENRRALEKSEKRYRDLFTYTLDGVCLHEMVYENGKAVDYRILDVNPTYVNITGIDRNTAVGSLASELYGSGEPPYIKMYARVVETGEPVIFETYFEPMDKHFRISVVSMEKRTFSTVFQDITKPKRMEEDLILERKNLQALLSASPAGTLVIDDEEKVYYANPAAMKIFGHEGLEKSKTQCGDFFSCTNRNRDPQGCGYSEDCTNCKILASIRNCLSESAETITEEGENLITRDDTHKSMWLKYKAQSLSMDDRRRVIIAVEDVTEIKQAAEAVRESEENLSITLHSIGDAVIATDKDGHITRMNEVAERLTGWPFTKARNKRLTEVFTIVNADSRKTVEDPVKIVLEKGRTVGLANHTVLISHDRNEYHIADSAAPIRDREGHTRGAIMVFSDITEKYRAQQKITSLAKFPGENPYPIFRISGDGALLYHNKASLSLLESHHVREGQYIPDTWRRAVENVLTSKTSREIEVALEDKVYSLVFLPVPESKYVNVYGYDITVRKKLETDLKNSNRIFNQALDMLCLAGFDGYFKVLNPSWSRTLGWSTEELLAKPWIEFVHPDDRAATARIKSVLAEGREIHQFENRYICKDGSITWLSWNSVPYPEENILIGVARDITERKVRDKNEKFI